MGRKKNKVVLTEEEKEIIVDEIANRMKDIVFMNAGKRAAEIVPLIDFNSEDTGSEVQFVYTINFLVNDFIQILGRKRRDEIEDMIRDLI